MTTLHLVTVVSTIIPAITQGGDQGAVVVGALELTLPTHSVGTGVRLIRPVPTVPAAVTLPIVRDTLLIIAAAHVLTTLGAAGRAGPVVPGVEHKVGGAGAGVGGAQHVTVGTGSNETHVGAAAIVELTRVVIRELSQRMVDVDIIWTVGGVAEDLIVSTSELVGSEDGLEVPVGPVDVVINEGDGEHMGHQLVAGQNVFLVASIKVGVGNVVQMSVRPPDLVGKVVHCDGVGPGQLVTIHCGHNGAIEVGAVHTNPADVGLEMPGGEEDVANARMDHQSTGIINASLDCLPVPSIQLTDTQMLEVSVQPVELLVDPVHGHALQPVAVVSDNVDSLLGSNLGLEDGLGGDITEVDIIILIEVVQSHDIPQVLMNQVVMSGISGHVPEVIFVGEQKPRLHSLIPSLAGPAIKLSLIEARVTLAREATGIVDTLLAAGAIRGHLHTFIDVLTRLAIRHQLEPGVAHTLVAVLGVHTPVVTPIVLHPGTLVLTAVQRLVRLVATVVPLVADQVVADTLLVATLPLALGTGGVGVGTVHLVTAIVTIVLAVTPILFVDTARVLTGELQGATGGILLSTMLALVTAITTVIIMVALPVLVDTPTIVALELVLTVTGVRWSVALDRAGAGHTLVLSVSTVGVTVTHPLLGDAHGLVEHGVLLTGELLVSITLSVVTLLSLILI